MIVIDFEVFKCDWLVCWLDCETRKIHHIINDKQKFEEFYQYYKNRIWVTYNGRQYDQWIAKAILCDFNPYEMNYWLINKERKGFEFSKLLNNFPIRNYDCSYYFRSLKELEAFMGDDIRETSVPFDIDRPLTKQELEDTISYCKHDVMETFKVFVETKDEFESHIGLIKEFGLPIENINKTKVQLSAIILGASKVKRNDEFNITIPHTLKLGKYEWIAEHFLDWARLSKNYDELTLKATVAGIPHVFGIGGLHGAVNNYFGDGNYLMLDVSSFYPRIMIEYNFLSRNVSNPSKYRKMLEERLIMKANNDPRESPRKIVLNGSFGASKDEYNNLYDPLQANNTCIAGQLLLVDLIEKIETKCELVQSNTDGLLIKVLTKNDKDDIINICSEWCKRTMMELDIKEYCKVIQKDVNNYIIVNSQGKIKSKGAYVKKLSLIDNDLFIVNKAVVDYFTKNIPVESTIMSSNKLIYFQKVTKITGKYDYGSHNGNILQEKVHRCFASLDKNDGSLYKKHKSKTTLDKTPSTPEKCFIDNGDINGKILPSKLDKQWYINLAKERIKDFTGS